MTHKDSSNRFSSLTIALHWLMLLLLVAAYACIELRVFYPKGSELRDAFKAWHFMLGLTVLLFAGLRIYARFRATVPPITPEPAQWQNLLAKFMHLALYAFMIGMPLLGWLLLSYSGKPIIYFGLELPALVGADKELASSVKEIHETIGTIGYYLIGLHALAALYHHYFLKDDTLKRMLPRLN